ncbi:MAG: FliM/FliN family flagellar motor switch protein [Acidobacteriia bacterium]|nr:FliM/FliN family flagellar motor switch protein [Terriglobia bacterium]
MDTENQENSRTLGSLKALPDSVADMPLNVHVTLGRTTMLLKDVFKMTVGSVIEMGQAANEPADLVTNGKVTARGQLVLFKGHYGLKVVAKVAHAKDGQ